MRLAGRKTGPVLRATPVRVSAREEGEGEQEKRGVAREAAQRAVQGAVQEALSGTVLRNGARNYHHRTLLLQMEGSWPLLTVVMRLWQRGAQVGATCELFT